LKLLPFLEKKDLHTGNMRVLIFGEEVALNLVVFSKVLGLYSSKSFIWFLNS